MAADLRTNDKPRYWVRQKAGATAEVDYLEPTGWRGTCMSSRAGPHRGGTAQPVVA